MILSVESCGLKIRALAKTRMAKTASEGDWQAHDIARPKRGMYDKWLFRDLDQDGDLELFRYKRE